jgi:recombination protein RecA
VNIDDLLVSQPDSGEQALEICELLVRSNAVDLIVVDSVAALIPKAEIEGEMGDAVVGLQARLMSQAMRKLTGVIARSQLHRHLHQPDPREDRRDVRLARDHDRRPRSSSTRRCASTSAASARSRRAIQTIGSRTRARVVKNKIAPPFREAEFDIMYNEGISAVGDLIDLAVRVECGVVQKSGRGTQLRRGPRRAQGREVSGQAVPQGQRRSALRKMASIDAYRSQFHAPEKNRAVVEWVRAQATYFGSRIGVAAGEPFFAREPLGLASLSSLV